MTNGGSRNRAGCLKHVSSPDLIAQQSAGLQLYVAIAAVIAGFDAFTAARGASERALVAAGSDAGMIGRLTHANPLCASVSPPVGNLGGLAAAAGPDLPDASNCDESGTNRVREIMGQRNNGLYSNVWNRTWRRDKLSNFPGYFGALQQQCDVSR